MNISRNSFKIMAAAVILSVILSGCVTENAPVNSSAVSPDIVMTTPAPVTETPISSDAVSTPQGSDNVSQETSLTDNSLNSDSESKDSGDDSKPPPLSDTENSTPQSEITASQSSTPQSVATTATATVVTTTTTAKKEEKPPVDNTPSPSYIVTPVADGKNVLQNDEAVIDASNSKNGYLMVKLKKAGSGKYKVVMDINGIRYTFTLDNSGRYTVIPLTEGSGSYSVYVLKQTSAGKGSTLLKKTVDVSIADEFAPFLTPNVNCTYDKNSKCVQLSSQLCGGGKTELEKITAVYEYVTDNIKYVSTAENGANGYVPYPDRTLSDGSGICYDYASLMTAMLRSQKIPTKVVAGYAGDVYHAWISVYVTGRGWVDGIISFDGHKWNRLDPTFTAGITDDTDYYKQLIEYIADNSNYSDMYYY